MKFKGALVKEQGVTFAIVVVKADIFDVEPKRLKALQSFGKVFPEAPIVLMTQEAGSAPRYFGRKDIVRFLSLIKPSQIPWKEYTLS